MADAVCAPMTVCAVPCTDEYEVQKPTMTSDRICRKSTTCTGFEYEAQGCSPVKDTVCKCTLFKLHVISYVVASGAPRFEGTAKSGHSDVVGTILPVERGFRCAPTLVKHILLPDLERRVRAASVEVSHLTIRTWTCINTCGTLAATFMRQR